MAGPTIETAIWLALKGRVGTLVLSPVLQIAWPKEAFNPPQGGTPAKPLPYLEVRHLPNTNTRLFLGNAAPHRRAGILQITLKYPTSLNHAEAVQTEIAGQIAAHFPTGHVMRLAAATMKVALKVEKAPDISQGFRDGTDPYWQTPVSIRYRLFK